MNREQTKRTFYNLVTEAFYLYNPFMRALFLKIGKTPLPHVAYSTAKPTPVRFSLREFSDHGKRLLNYVEEASERDPSVQYFQEDTLHGPTLLMNIPVWFARYTEEAGLFGKGSLISEKFTSGRWRLLVDVFANYSEHKRQLEKTFLERIKRALTDTLFTPTLLSFDGASFGVTTQHISRREEGLLYSALDNYYYPQYTQIQPVSYSSVMNPSALLDDPVIYDRPFTFMWQVITSYQQLVHELLHAVAWELAAFVKSNHKIRMALLEHILR